MGWFDILKAGTGKFDLGAANRLANEVFGEGTTGSELTSLFPDIGGNNMRERISSFAKNVIVNKIPNESDVKFVERHYERYLTKLNKLEETIRYELSGLHGARVVLDQLLNENSVETKQENEEQ